MSHDQSRFEKKREGQPRKSGRNGNSGSHRGFSDGGGGRTSGGSTSQPTSMDQSFKKSGNGQRGQPMVNPASVSSEANITTYAAAVQNGAHGRPPSFGLPNAPLPTATTPTDSVVPRTSTALPKATPSQYPAETSSLYSPSTPDKGDGAKLFPFQFGSISPGIVDRMQIPVRTTSAPPNLDERKQGQANQEPFKAMPTLPVPSGPKQQLPLPRKDVRSSNQSTVGASHSPGQLKRDSHPQISNVAASPSKPAALSICGISTAMPFQQKVHMQYGCPRPQQIPMSLPIGNDPLVPQQMLVHNFQPHPFQPHPMIHQGQSLGFARQISPPQFAHPGFCIPTQQFVQQQPEKFGGPHKPTVTITDPETHEVLMLDKITNLYTDGGSWGQRSIPNANSESQQVPSPFSTSPYFPQLQQNSYFIPPSTPLLSSSQASRFSYPAGQHGPAISTMNPFVPNSMICSNSMPPLHTYLANLSPPVYVPSAPVQGSAKQTVIPFGPKVGAHQPSESKVFAYATQQQPETVSEIPGITKNVSGEDIRNRHFPTNLDNNQDSSGESVSTTIANLPHGGYKSSITEVRTGETTEEKIVCSGSGSSGVILKKEELPDVPQICSDSVELVDGGEIPMKDEGTSEKSMTSGPEMDGSISKDFGSTIHQADHHSPEVETKKGMPGEKEIRHSEVSFTSILDCRNAKVHPVPTAADTSETLKPVVSVRKKDSGEDSSGKLIAYNRQESQKQQCVSLSVQKIAEVKDRHAVAFPATSKAKAIPSSGLPAVNNIKDGPSALYVSTNKSETVCSGDIGSSMPGTPNPGSSSVGEGTLQAANKLDIDVTELHRDSPAHAEASKGKSTKEPNRSKPISGKKKKRRAILSKADAGGAGTSDLYNAYKGPEEKHQLITTSGGDHSITEDGTKVSAEDSHKNVGAGEKQSKAELNDWEDAAYAAPKLGNGDLVKVVDKYRDNDENEATGTKKYTRDFLLTFSDKCTDLPIGFEIGSDIASSLMSVPVSSSHVIYRDHNPSPGRIKDRMPAVSRGDRCMIGSMDDDKWIKRSGSFNLHDPRGDVGHGSVLNFRPGQGLAHGILRNPRGPPQNYFLGGILSGPMQSPEAQGVLVRNGSGVDSWRSSNSRGLMPHPQTTMQVMHKAEKKYEVGKVSDEEEVKQRRLKAILNKLTPQNFEKLFEQVKEVNIDNTVTLAGVISQIFDKALMEPTFCEMYANFCFHMSSELPDFIENDDKITFRRLLLSKCQEEFERGEREQAEANRDGEEEEIKQSEEVKEEKRIKARRRMLGNIRLIGELYKKRMLTENIMHECIKKLLGQYQNPDEEDIEALCKLMSTIGEIIDHPKAKKLMDAYFSRMLNLSTNETLSSRIRFMLRDAIDLRNNKWQQRRKTEGPKKIEEVHRDAAQERQSQASRLTRGPSINSGTRRGPPVDYGPWGSNVSSSSRTQVGGIHGSAKVREHVIRGARLEEQHSLENRVLPVLLPQRRTDDSSIILGPQGGLARGTSAPGQPLISSVPLTGISSNSGELSRKMAGPNGHSTASDRTLNSSRDSIDRYVTSTEPGGRSLESLSGSSSVASDAKSLSEDLLRKKSISTIREFYSAKDEEEVALCIKELDSPSFHPSMVSLWVTDSFERKDMDRDLLATLLVNLCKSQDGLLSHVQLTQGFEYVLSSLEDAVNDAPKAAEFLGCIFAKVILENVVPLRDIGTLIHEGGEEPGRLLEVGLASEVLGSILEIIRLEKGDPFVQEIRVRSSLHLPDFLPPRPIKSKKLEAFL